MGAKWLLYQLKRFYSITMNTADRDLCIMNSVEISYEEWYYCEDHFTSLQCDIYEAGRKSCRRLDNAMTGYLYISWYSKLLRCIHFSKNNNARECLFHWYLFISVKVRWLRTLPQSQPSTWLLPKGLRAVTTALPVIGLILTFILLYCQILVEKRHLSFSTNIKKNMYGKSSPL